LPLLKFEQSVTRTTFSIHKRKVDLMNLRERNYQSINNKTQQREVNKKNNQSGRVKENERERERERDQCVDPTLKEEIHFEKSIRQENV
jgi:hypothetical protein